VGNATGHKNPIDLVVWRQGTASRKRMSHFFYEKETVACGRKEKQENEIGENLSLEKRKKEKRPARRKNSPELKDRSQDRLRQIYLGAHE
jgi:hypothetical protein